ncbi:MAG: hypothetical protein L0228_07485 [Planctomycetes bacterium]|nr:hypothetical protein [Planctomycetota bacterium]
MARRLLCVVAICSGLAVAAPAYSADLHAQLFPLTGEVRLLNKSATPVPIVFYSVTSASGALDGSSAVWKSITENYDQPSGATPGNGLVDPNGDWFKLSSNATELTEGALDLDGGSLPAFRAISLGNIWIPHLVDFPDLVFDIHDDVQTIPVTIELTLDGDYSPNQVVDQADYVVWRRYVNSMTAYFADGNLDGVVDIGDYLVWQKNFGVTLPLPPYGIGAGDGGLLTIAGGVPEPTSAILFVLAAGFMPIVVPRGGRSRRR